MSKSNVTIEAIDKMRNVINWANWQNESFNSRFKSMSDIEKAYDFANKKDIEFLDNLNSYDFEDYEVIEIQKELTGILGYNIF